MGIPLPSPATLRKYGLTLLGWLDMADAQGWACAVCQRTPSTGRLVVDHEHIPGYAKLPVEERGRYVRGLLCWTCNRFLLARDMSVDVAARIVLYLEAYEKRRDA